MKRIAMLAALCGVSHVSFAFSTYDGLVTPYFYGGGLYISIAGTTTTGVPACATRPLVRLQEGDPNDPVFKMKFSILLSAHMAQRPVQLQGTGQCTSEGDEIVFVVIPK